MQVRTYHDITEDEVGKDSLDIFGKHWRVADFMGQILQDDVGKRIFHNWDSGTLSVETNIQYRARLKGYGGRA